MKHIKLFENYKIDNITESDIIDTIENNGTIQVLSIKDKEDHKEDDYMTPVDIDGDSIIVDIDGEIYTTKLEFVTSIKY